MDTPTDVDRSAPVLAHHEVEIPAPLDTVWQLHIDVNDWPSWQEAISEAHIDRRFEPGNITGVHEWLFAEPDGGVRVTTNESFAGDPVSADVAGMQAQLDASLVAWLDYLRSAAASSG